MDDLVSYQETAAGERIVSEKFCIKNVEPIEDILQTSYRLIECCIRSGFVNVLPQAMMQLSVEQLSTKRLTTKFRVFTKQKSASIKIEKIC